MTDIDKQKLKECQEAGLTIEQALQYLEVAPEKSVEDYIESIRPSIEEYRAIMNNERPNDHGTVNLFPEPEKKK